MPTMSSPYSQPYPKSGQGPPRSGPSRRWYAIAAVLAVASLVVATLIGFSVGGKVKDAGVEPVGGDGTIEITAGKQLAVYVEGPLVDDPTLSVRPTCTATPDGGGPRVEFLSPSASLNINDWERIALSPKGAAAGRYDLACSPGNSAEMSNLGVGNNPEVGGVIVRVVGALAVGGLGMLIALVIAIVTAVRRHQQQRPATRGQ